MVLGSLVSVGEMLEWVQEMCPSILPDSGAREILVGRNAQGKWVPERCCVR
jgi:hypothetical protein